MGSPQLALPPGFVLDKPSSLPPGFVLDKPPPGLIERGNIDLSAQPIVQNPDGTSSTVDSVSYNFDGKEVLLSRIHPAGHRMDDEQAIEYYRREGKHLGIFDTPENATAYAGGLHEDYESGRIKPFVGPQRGTPYEEQVAAMGGMPPPMPPPLEVARRAVPAPETVVGRGGGLLAKEHEYAQMIGRMPSMRDAIMPVIVGEIGHLVPAPETTTEAVGNAIAKTAVGLMSAQGLATLLAAGGIGSGLRVLANSPKVAVALRGYPEVLKGIDLASKTAIPATFGGMGAVGTVEALEAAGQAETEPERIEALTHAGLSGVITAAGAAGVVKGARRPYHEWEFGQRRAPTSKQIAGAVESRPKKAKPAPALKAAPAEAPAKPRVEKPVKPERYDEALKLVQGQEKPVVSRRPLVEGLAVSYDEAGALMNRMVDEGHLKPLPLNRYEVAGKQKELKPEAPAKPAELPSKQLALEPVRSAQPEPKIAILPRDLAGAKPRYSYGNKQFTLEFASDLDRAAYITAQKILSKRDADYLAFAMKSSGMSEAQARAYGAQVRNVIKEQARSAESGLLKISRVGFRAAPAKVAPPKAEVPAKPAGGAVGADDKLLALANRGLTDATEALRSSTPQRDETTAALSSVITALNAIEKDSRLLEAAQAFRTKAALQNRRAQLEGVLKAEPAKQPPAKVAKVEAPAEEVKLTPTELRQRAKRMVVRPDLQERIDAEVAAAAAKQPWEMTYREFFDEAGSEHTAGSRFGIPTKNAMPIDPDTGHRVKGAIPEERIHRAVIQKALREGKPVPAAVLADYPGLAKLPNALQQAVARRKAATQKAKPTLAQRRKALLERRRRHFTPGNIVFKAYWREHDKVLDYKEKADGSWSVQVQAVDETGKTIPGAHPRWHSTELGSGDKIVIEAVQKPAPKDAPKPKPKPPSVILGSGLGSIQPYFDRPLSPLVTRSLQTVANAIDDVAVRKALRMMELLPVQTKIAVIGGKPGEKLAKHIERVSGWGKVSAGKRLVQLSDARLDKLDRDQRFELLDALEGRGTAQDAAVATAFTPSREVLDDIGAEAVGLDVAVQHTTGKKPFEARADYFPHVFRGPSAMRRGQLRKDIIENVTHHLKVRSTEASSEKFLNEYILSLETGEWHASIQQHLVDTNQADNKAEALKKLNRFRIPVQRQGNLEFAREVDLPFYDPDPVRVLPQHVLAASLRLAQIAEYGQENVVIAKAVKEIAALPGNIRTQQERASQVKDAMERVIGWVNQAEAAAERKSRMFRAIQGFKLGLAAIPNATQGVLNTSLALDLPSVAIGFASMFSRGGRRFAIEAGALVDPLLHETVDETTEAGRSMRMLQKSLRVYLRAVGFTGTERMNRTLAANAGGYFAERQMRRLRKNSADKQARGLLEDMGLDVDAALKRGGLSPDDVLIAANWTSRITQFGSDPATAPLWFSTPAGKVFMQYKNFPYNQTRLVHRAVTGEFQKGRPGRGFRNLLILAVLFPIAGEIVKDLRDLLTGRKREEELLSFERYMEDVGQASATGIFMDIAESAKYGRLEGVALGPTGGDFLDFGGGVVFGYSSWGTKASRLKALQRFVENRSPVVRVGKHAASKTEEWYRSRSK